MQFAASAPTQKIWRLNSLRLYGPGYGSGSAKRGEEYTVLCTEIYRRTILQPYGCQQQSARFNLNYVQIHGVMFDKKKMVLFLQAQSVAQA
jgi:hypothetical protein